jgi:hypothetical protein
MDEVTNNFLETLIDLVEQIEESGQIVTKDNLVEFLTGESYDEQVSLMRGRNEEEGESLFETNRGN